MLERGASPAGTIPLGCPHTLAYGLICAKNPPQEVMRFILAVGQVGKAG